MKRVCVFCGSSSGTDAIFEKQAYALGKALAMRNIELVYGGACIGLMGVVANGVIENGGRAIGVVPKFLDTIEISHAGLTELIVVETMHQRKSRMSELSDGVIALPGGYGTLEEVFEILTWGQLGLHKKPVAMLNTNGFYNDLTALLDGMVENGFLKPSNRDMLLVSDDIDTIFTMMESYAPPTDGKWIK